MAETSSANTWFVRILLLLMAGGGAVVCGLGGVLVAGAVWIAGTGVQHDVIRVVNDDCTRAAHVVQDDQMRAWFSELVVYQMEADQGRTLLEHEKRNASTTAAWMLPRSVAYCEGSGGSRVFALNPASMGNVLKTMLPLLENDDDASGRVELQGYSFVRMGDFWVGMVDGTVLAVSEETLLGGALDQLLAEVPTESPRRTALKRLTDSAAGGLIMERDDGARTEATFRAENPDRGHVHVRIAPLPPLDEDQPDPVVEELRTLCEDAQARITPAVLECAVRRTSPEAVELDGPITEVQAAMRVMADGLDD